MASTPAPETGPITSRLEPDSNKKLAFLLLALVLYGIVLALPQPAGLSASTQARPERSHNKKACPNTSSSTPRTRSRGC